MSSLEKLTIYCECRSTEHNLVFTKDLDDDQVWLEVHLCNHKGFFKRLWAGLKYAVGHRSRYGDWDCVEISDHDRKRIIKLLTETQPRQEGQSTGEYGC